MTPVNVKLLLPPRQSRGNSQLIRKMLPLWIGTRYVPKQYVFSAFVNERYVAGKRSTLENRDQHTECVFIDECGQVVTVVFDEVLW